MQVLLEPMNFPEKSSTHTNTNTDVTLENVRRYLKKRRNDVCTHPHWSCSQSVSYMDCVFSYSQRQFYVGAECYLMSFYLFFRVRLRFCCCSVYIHASALLSLVFHRRRRRRLYICLFEMCSHFGFGFGCSVGGPTVLCVVLQFKLQKRENPIKWI